MANKSGRMEDLTLHLVCLDSKTGEIIWDERIKPTLPESKTVRDHGYAAQTPVTDGEHLYVFFGKSGVFKFDLQGNQIWRTSVGTKTHDWGSGTSPVLYENLVIVNASVESGSLVAIDKNTGKEVWRAAVADQLPPGVAGSERHTPRLAVGRSATRPSRAAAASAAKNRSTSGSPASRSSLSPTR